MSWQKNNNPCGKYIEKSIISFDDCECYDAVINGFGLPYLTKEQRYSSFVSAYNSLKKDGYFFISFMEGNKEGYEVTSYNPNEQFYIYYHMKNDVLEELSQIGYVVIKEWTLDYQESDGSITNDIVLVLKKSN